jgi:hypothetical protein
MWFDTAMYSGKNAFNGYQVNWSSVEMLFWDFLGIISHLNAISPSLPVSHTYPLIPLQTSSFKRYEISWVHRRAVGHSTPYRFLQVNALNMLNFYLNLTNFVLDAFHYVLFPFYEIVLEILIKDC